MYKRFISSLPVLFITIANSSRPAGVAVLGHNKLQQIDTYLYWFNQFGLILLSIYVPWYIIGRGFHEKTVLRFDSLPESCKASTLLGRHLLMKATISQACGAKRP